MNQPEASKLHTRRRFLLTGGAASVGAVALGACSAPTTVNTSGTVATTLVAATAPPTTATKAAVDAARSLLRTATSLEHSLAAFYDSFTAAGYLDDTARSWGEQFAGHHRANATALEDLTRAADAEPYTETNEYVDTELVEPALQLTDASQSPEELIGLAAQLESTGAATCTLGVAELVDGDQRAGIMAVGATNARHAYVWRLLLDPGDLAAALPEALHGLADALPVAASVDAEATD